MTADATNAVKVAVSYSHRDEKLRQQLETHLSMLQRQGFIKVWHDRLIEAGAEWREQIDDHFESADLILLLVSPDFLDSDYCYEVELERALERHEAGTVVVIPIILRPVDWYDAPFSKLQALPRDGKPIVRWSNRDEAFKSVVAGIKRVVREIQERNAGRIVDFLVRSYGTHDATVEWEVSDGKAVRISVYRGTGKKPKIFSVPPAERPGVQSHTIEGLRPATTYHIVAETDDDRQETIVKTLEGRMR